MTKSIVHAALALMLAAAGQASATVVDTVQSPSGYFLPDDSQAQHPTYFRLSNQDWSWTHHEIAGGIQSATLGIRAWDVDLAQGEIDNIYGFDNGTSTWKLIGALGGEMEKWSVTTFNLDSSLYDDIASGLQVKIDIDTANTFFWRVSLSKSVLTVEQKPGAVPLPAAAWLFGSGMLGMLGMRTRRNRI